MKKLISAIVLGVSMLMSVNLAEAAAAGTLTLKWPPSAKPVTGYEVYYGKTAELTKMRLLATPVILNLKSPTVQFDVLRDLGALPGQRVCFRVKAYDNTSRSSFSDAMCRQA